MRARLCARLSILIIIGLIAAAPLTVFGKNTDNTNAPSAKQARRILEANRSLAINGDASAQYNMGVLYDQGYGVTQNYAKARQWYEKAAAQHYGRAEHNLGIMYEAGKGVARDPDQAARWFRRGADDGQAASQNNLAVLYMKGEGVPRNKSKAAFWSARAAAAGNSAAIGNLASITRQLSHEYANADGVNVRDQPDDQARVVRHVDSDTVVVVLAGGTDWTQVLLPRDYTVGWIANSLLSESQAPLAGESPRPATQTAGSDQKPAVRPGRAPHRALKSSVARSPTAQTKATPRSEPAALHIVRTLVLPPTAPKIVRRRVVARPAKRRIPRSRGAPTASTDPPVKSDLTASEQKPGVTRDLSMIAGTSDKTRPTQQDKNTKTPVRKTARVGVNLANVRARPVLSATIVGRLRRGDEVELLGERSGWRHIRTKRGGVKGWIAGFLLILSQADDRAGQ